jgi:hypothetical protein
VSGDVAGKTGTVTAAAFDRPGAPTWRVPIGDAKQLAVAVRIRRRRGSGDKSASRGGDNRQDMLVAMGVDAEHVVQLVCKHQTRFSDLVRRVRWCRSDARETAAAGR